MAQFDVFRNPNPSSSRAVPLLLVVQSGLLDDLPSCVVAPMVKLSTLRGSALTRLNPIFKIGGEAMVMLTQQLGAVPTRSLVKRVTSLARERSVIIGAVDFLLGGV